MRIKYVTYWTFVIFLGAAFLLVGTGKLMAIEAWQQRFVEQWGLPGWLATVTGFAEVAGALLVLYPKTTPVGGALLGMVMLGATGSHVMAQEWSNVPVTVVLGLLAFVVMKWSLTRATDGGPLATQQED